jgi:formylglycine-generating enzyme required for sulfatase activity
MPDTRLRRASLVVLGILLAVLAGLAIIPRLGRSPAPPPDETAPPPTASAEPAPELAPPQPIVPTLPPVEPPAQITNSIGIKLVLIPAGEFLMGSPDSDPEAFDDEKPQHPVRLTRSFLLGETEVTQDQYRVVMGQNPSGFKGSNDLPVELVSWLDAIRFCNALSVKEGLAPTYQIQGENVADPDSSAPGYRLPTEAEWEYACRGGNPGRYSFGNDAASLGEYAWFSSNSGRKTQPVRQKRPNGFNLYDMHGNVYEWCWDRSAKYDARSLVVDPPGARAAADRVLRGGGWSGYPQVCRSADRGGNAPAFRNDDLGFRVARFQSESR